MTPQPPASLLDDRRCLVFLTLLWIAALVVLRPFGDFPLNDDWVFARSVRAIVEHGRFELADWSQAMGFPQAYWGALFASVFDFSFTVLRASMWVLGLGGVFATYLLLREVRAAPAAALAGAACCAANPLYFSLSNTFMTDVPFYFFGTFCLFAWTRWFHGGRLVWLVLGTLSCYLGILTRQFGFALLGGFVLALFWQEGPRARQTALAALVLGLSLALHGGLQHWLELQGRHASMEFSPQAVVARLYWVMVWRVPRFFLYLGTLLAPCAVLALATRIGKLEPEKRRTVLLRFALVFAVFVAAFALRRVYFPSWGNVVAPWGIGPLAQKDTLVMRINLPTVPKALWAVWDVFTLLGIGSLALLVAGWTESLRQGAAARLAARVRQLPRATVFLLLSGAAYAFLVCLLPVTYFDRYVLLGLPIAAALALPSLLPEGSRAGRPAYIVCAGLLLATLALSLLATRDFLDWNDARWQAFRALEAKGIGPEQVDGGYEYNGWYLYRHGGAVLDSGKSWWWVKDDEYLVASGPVPGYREIAAYPYRRLLLGETGRVLVLQRGEGAAVP